MKFLRKITFGTHRLAEHNNGETQFNTFLEKNNNFSLLIIPNRE